jgi:hypothetical protein
LKFEPKVYVLLVIDMGYTTLSVYTYECTREPNRARLFADQLPTRLITGIYLRVSSYDIKSNSH